MIVSSCARVKIKNQEWCGDKGPLGAHCWNTLNDKERDITPSVWNALKVGPDHRFGKACTEIENITDTKAAIINLCKASKRCTFEDEANVIRWEENAKEFATQAEGINGLLGEEGNDTI